MKNCLYLVLTSNYRKEIDPLKIAEQAIEGGVDILQMREKDLSKDQLLFLGKQYRELCNRSNTVFIVNDDPELSVELDACGVHMGQEDLKKYKIKGIRSIVSKKRIIGLSTHNLKQFREANMADIDYIAFGPLFRTKTKDYFIGTNDLITVLKEAVKPVFCIGGITLKNVEHILTCGASNIAVISAIMKAEDITLQTKIFKDCIRGFNEDRA